LRDFGKIIIADCGDAGLFFPLIGGSQVSVPESLLCGSMSYPDRVEKSKVGGILGVGKELRLRCQRRVKQEFEIRRPSPSEASLGRRRRCVYSSICHGFFSFAALEGRGPCDQIRN
jgi:hypothetical protein